jgi:hypothetical protein
MKYRLSFVTNSSSASFVIQRKDLSFAQIYLIKKHMEVARHLNLTECGYFDDDYDAWLIQVNDNTVEGYTTMDNFNMWEFLKHIGVPEEVIEYEGD